MVELDMHMQEVRPIFKEWAGMSRIGVEHDPDDLFLRQAVSVFDRLAATGTPTARIATDVLAFVLDYVSGLLEAESIGGLPPEFATQARVVQGWLEATGQIPAMQEILKQRGAGDRNIH